MEPAEVLVVAQGIAQGVGEVFTLESGLGEVCGPFQAHKGTDDAVSLSAREGVRPCCEG